MQTNGERRTARIGQTRVVLLTWNNASELGSGWLRVSHSALVVLPSTFIGLTLRGSSPRVASAVLHAVSLDVGLARHRALVCGISDTPLQRDHWASWRIETRM